MYLSALRENMPPDLKVELERLKAAGRYHEFIPVSERQGAYVKYKEKRIVDFTNWDLFYVTRHSGVIWSIHKELESWGVGSNSPRLISGTNPQHISLEKRLAVFTGRQAAALFTSRNQAVLSLVTTLLDERSVVVVDELMQSPVVDAAYLVNAPVVTFDAGKIETLDIELAKIPESFRKVVFLEGISPLRGRCTELKPTFDIAADRGGVVVLDESFSMGVLGIRGAGASELLPPGYLPLCCYGPLSYGLSGFGAFVSGDQILIDYLVNQSRTFTSESALPCAFVAGMETALDVIELSVSGREKIGTLTNRLRRGLSELGLAESEDGGCPIVCIPFESRSMASELVDALMEKGFLVEAVARGGFLDSGCVVRALVNIEHTERHIDGLLQAIADALSQIKKNAP